MPRFDGKGPSGFGQMTGRGMGFCGCGMGYGRGFGRRFYNRKEELDMLKEESDVLKEELKAVEEKMVELKSQK